MSSYLHENPFLEEVFGLFALEAEEWMTQCKTALLELECQPSEDRRAKLYDTIICAITNLGGSAATVELPALEKLSFALVPLLQTMQERGSRSPAEQLAALRDGLDQITLSIKHLEETKNGTIPGLENILVRLVDAVTLPCMPDPPAHSIDSSLSTQPVGNPADAPTLPEAPPRDAELSPAVLLEALRGLERSGSQLTDHSRHIVEAVIKKAKGEHPGEHNGSHLDATTIGRILDDLEARDEQFLEELRRRLPIIEHVLSELQASGSDVWGSHPRAEEVLQEIHVLHEAARALEAKPIMLFFHGLQTFLGVLTRNGVAVLPRRIEAVATRLQAILPLAQEWVEIGRLERAHVHKVVHP